MVVVVGTWYYVTLRKYGVRRYIRGANHPLLPHHKKVYAKLFIVVAPPADKASLTCTATEEANFQLSLIFFLYSISTI